MFLSSSSEFGSVRVVQDFCQIQISIAGVSEEDLLQISSQIRSIFPYSYTKILDRSQGPKLGRPCVPRWDCGLKRCWRSGPGPITDHGIVTGDDDDDDDAKLLPSTSMCAACTHRESSLISIITAYCKSCTRTRLRSATSGYLGRLFQVLLDNFFRV